MSFLERRSQDILMHLARESRPVSADELSAIFEMSKRTIYYDISKINAWLEELAIEPIQAEGKKGYYLNGNQKQRILKELSTTSVDKRLTAEERQKVILISILKSPKKQIVEEFQALTDVSRNTIFSDLDEINRYLRKYELKLIYDYDDGYIIPTSEIVKRSLFLEQFLKISHLVKQGYFEQNSLTFLKKSAITPIYEALLEVEKALATEYVKGFLYGISSLYLAVLENPAPIELSLRENDYKMIKKSQEKVLLKNVLTSLGEHDYDYFTLHLIGGPTQVHLGGLPANYYVELATKLVERFEKLSSIKFRNRVALVYQLANHLSLSYYRYLYGINAGNPLLGQIKENYQSLFNVTNRAVDILRSTFQVPISDGEVGFITLHFGSFIKQELYQHEYKTVDIVCPNGVSTSSMIEMEILSLSPQIKVNKKMSLREFNTTGSQADYLISTISIDAKDYLKINPVLNHYDKMKIMEYLQLDEYLLFEKMSEVILKVVKPYLKDEKYLDEIQEALKQIEIHALINKEEVKSKEGLIRHLPLSHIRYISQPLTWQEALQYSSEILVDKGYCDTYYIEEMIAIIDTHKAYMVLDNGFMIAHGSEKHVKKLGLSYTQLKHPVEIYGKSADKIFVVTPPDRLSHEEIMRDLLRIFSDDHFATHLDMLSSPVDIYSEFINLLKV